MQKENYIQNILSFKKDLTSYINSDEFLTLTKHTTGNYFMDNYFADFAQICTSGKCVRSYLVSLIYKLFEGKNFELALKVSASYELFEGSVLAHDDIIDKSEVRRGKPALHIKLGNNHLGVSRAICVGDFGLIFANELINSLDLDEKVKQKAISHQTKVYLTTISGELLDVDMSNGDTFGESSVLEMYRQKTANYTIAGPMVLGGIIAGLSDEKLIALQNIGENLGIAFQIKDDILGIFGEENKIGKSNTSDAEEGKKTILVAHFNKTSNDENKQKFFEDYGKPSAKENIEKIKELLTESGSLAYANVKLEEYYKNAITAITKSDFTGSVKDALKDFADYILKRER